MTNTILSDELRRFIQAIESIPHLEAMLLLRQNETDIWDENTISKRLYLSPEKASMMLTDLCALGICTPINDNRGFVFSRKSGLVDLLDELAAYYASHLIEVTNIIHANAKTGSRIHLFASAFDFQRKN